MKLPQILAQEVLEVTPQPRARPVDMSSGLLAVSQAIGKASETLATVAEEKRKQSIANEAMLLTTKAVEGWEHAYEGLRVGRQDALGNVVEPPAGHADYVRRAAEARRRVTDKVLAGASDDEVRGFVQRRLGAMELERIRSDYRTATTLFLDTQRAELEQISETWAKDAALNPESEARARRKREFANFLRAKQPLLGETGIVTEQRKFDQAVDLTAATAAIEAGTFSPETAIVDYPNLDGATLVKLRDAHAQEQRQRQAALMEGYAEGKRNIFSWIAAEAQGGRLSHQEFDVYQGTWLFDAAQQQHIRNLVDNKADGDSDPATLREIRRRIFSPTFSAADKAWLDDLYARPGQTQVGGKDYERYAALGETKLRQLEADRRHDLAERRTEAREQRVEDRLARAEERDRERDREQRTQRYVRIAERTLRIGSDDPLVRGVAESAMASYEDEYWRRYEAGEDPRDIHEDLFPRTLALAQRAAVETTKTTIRELRQRGIDAETVEALGTFEDAQRRFGLDRDTYKWAVRRLFSIEWLEHYAGEERRLRPTKPAPATPPAKEAPTPRGAPGPGSRSRERGYGMTEFFGRPK